MVVTLRAAKTLDIDKEKIETYINKPAAQKRAYVVFSAVIFLYLIGIAIFYLNIEGVWGGLLTIFLATIVLSGFFEEIIFIKRCESGYKPKV